MLFPSSYFSVQWISFLLPLRSSPFHRNSGPVLTSLHFSTATRRHTLRFLRISTPITSAAAHRIANQFPSLLHLAFPLHISVVLCFAIAILGNSIPKLYMALRLLSPARQISAMLLACTATLCYAITLPSNSRQFIAQALQYGSSPTLDSSFPCQHNASLFFALARHLSSMLFLCNAPLCNVTPCLRHTRLCPRISSLLCAYA